ERSIRNAIDQVWSTENVLLQRTFSTRPTNTQFISWVSEKVRIENGLVSK
ncbi:MAG TPA: hypothetical protein DDZ89_06500, partial [Clostridiales bacterium]|nr:hypothetical protein [Clostridiales bacterium]